jgi:hypothetical protein
MNAVPKIASYEGVDIILKSCLINTYLDQSVITGYKLQSGYMDYIYKLYQNEPFVVPAEIIYNDNFGVYPHGNGIDATKQFKFTHVKEVYFFLDMFQIILFNLILVSINYALVCSTMIIQIKKLIQFLQDF